MRLSLYLKLVAKSLIIESISTGIVSNNLLLHILILFAGWLSMRGTSEHFGLIILWTIMQGRVVWVQKYHLSGFIQPCSRKLSVGCQPSFQIAISDMVI